jgi:hypothetical protein
LVVYHVDDNDVLHADAACHVRTLPTRVDLELVPPDRPPLMFCSLCAVGLEQVPAPATSSFLAARSLLNALDATQCVLAKVGPDSGCPSDPLGFIGQVQQLAPLPDVLPPAGLEPLASCLEETRASLVSLASQLVVSFSAERVDRMLAWDLLVSDEFNSARLVAPSGLQDQIGPVSQATWLIWSSQVLEVTASPNERVACPASRTRKRRPRLSRADVNRLDAALATAGAASGPSRVVAVPTSRDLSAGSHLHGVVAVAAGRLVPLSGFHVLSSLAARWALSAGPWMGLHRLVDVGVYQGDTRAVLDAASVLWDESGGGASPADVLETARILASTPVCPQAV